MSRPDRSTRPNPDMEHQQWGIEEPLGLAGGPWVQQTYRTEALARAEVSDWPADRPYRIVVRTISAWRPIE